MVMTITEFATAQGVDYAIAAGTIKFLTAKGLVKEAGSRSIEGKKGKPSALFDIPDTVTLELVKKVAIAA